MSTIFGICRRGSCQLTARQWQALCQATGLSPQHGEESYRAWGAAVIGSAGADGTLVTLPGPSPGAPPFGCVAAATIHNGAELVAELGSDIGKAPADADLIRAAYQRWGEGFSSRVFGDWCFAAWHPAERRLFLARDHLGNTSLYYYADADLVAFSTSRRLLLAMRLAPVELDDLYLAQVLISWPAYEGERTIHSPIKRLPPAHCVTVTPERIDLRQYWRLEDTPELRLPRREDYVAGLREVFDRAVRERLPREGRAAVTLSGGLDSGAVTATAAAMLRERGQRLTAYTSVPLADPAPYVGARFGDEFPFAKLTAEAAQNVDLRRAEARSLTPVQGVKAVLDICREPLHAAVNFYWLLDLYRTAAQDGHCRLLTGQMGNAGISWNGDVFSQALAVQLRQVGLRQWLRRRIRPFVPGMIVDAVRRLRGPHDWTTTAIAADFAERLRLQERRLADPWEAPYLTPRQQRLNIVRPGASIVGFLHAELGAACGIAVSDPTADARVLSYSFSVPDHVFFDAETGTDRWLIREAMKGRLPDQVRLNRGRGRQAGDVVPRLRASAAEVEAALDEIANGPSAAYLDVAHMRRTWNRLRVVDDQDSFRLAVTVLLRGIMAGLFVNGFGKTW